MTEIKLPPTGPKWTPLRPTLWGMTSEKRRPRPAAQYGPTGATVAANVRRVREARGLTIYELSGALDRAGRAIAPSAVAKIERKERQVSVDDLMALSVVLGVSPSALLLPVGVEQHDEVEMTGSRPVTAYTAWHWLDGRGPLSLPRGNSVAAGRAVYEELMQYRLFGRPHWLVDMEEEAVDETARLRLRVQELEEQLGGVDG